MTDWKQFFSGKRVTVMGLGLLGRGVGDISFIATYAREVVVTDLKSEKDLKESISKLKRFKNISYTLGRHDYKDFENRDFILKAAGVPLDSPFIARAEENNIPVYMSTALFALLSEATIVGTTGTRGKTTVTYMVYDCLRKWRKGKGKVFLGGNIRGVSTLPMLARTKKGDIAVLELDSWQLQGFGSLKISPQVAVFTTFMPDHLNYYKGDLKAYFADKANIFINQKKGDTLIVGDQVKGQKDLKLPSRARIVSVSDLPARIRLAVPGEHNRYNAALAYAVLESLKVPKKVIKESLEKFRGVPGRLERLPSKSGILVYNDTTATTPQALRAALEALGAGERVVLIAGGSDKDIDLSILSGPLGRSCKALVLLPGGGTDRLLAEKIVPEAVPVYRTATMKAAVKKAFSVAQKGDTILLSPGFASFGLFKNEYDRGDQFESEIKKLK